MKHLNKIIVGLGNPEQRFENNRHNIGFKVIDDLSFKYGILLDKTLDRTLYGSGNILGKEVCLVKPQTYMNSSGESVKLVMPDGFDIKNVIVIHDEIDLVLGRIKVKAGGSDAGHNGIKSVASNIGRNFTRIRLGVDKPNKKEMSVYDYVLSDFKEEEILQVRQLVIDAVGIIEGILKNG